MRIAEQQAGARSVLFPERAAPKVATYNLKATYGKLLDSVERAFNKKKPLFVLGISTTPSPTGSATRPARTSRNGTRAGRSRW